MTSHFLTDIEIKQFKCFTDFTASGFKRVNLIGGKNNIGKTAFMEACYVNVRGNSIDDLFITLIAVKFMRESINYIFKNNNHDTSVNFLDSTGYYDTSSNINKITFFSKVENAKKEYVFKINEVETIVNANELYFNINGEYDTRFIDNFGFDNQALSNVYQFIQKFDKEEELNTLIQQFDDSIEKFKVIGNKPQCKVKDEYRDITEFGDGLKHYISIICALYSCENGYLFIDEIDNGIHYTQLDRLWTIILKTSAKTNCQVFATTHSKEMLESFVRVSKQLNEQDISYTLLVKNKQQEIKTISFDYEMLEYSLSQEHEVR